MNEEPKCRACGIEISVHTDKHVKICYQKLYPEDKP